MSFSRLLLAILRWVTSTDFAESAAGDLEERRKRSHGGAGWRRYWLGLWSILTFAIVARLWSLCHPVWTSIFGRNHVTELRQAGRSLMRAPWYTASVVSVMALGMALAIAVFAIVDGLLFKPLPYPEVDGLVAVTPGFRSLPSSVGRPSGSSRDVADWRMAIPDASFTGVQVNHGSQPSTLLTLGSGLNEPGLQTAAVDSAFFDTIGLRPLLGGFRPEDFAEDEGAPVPILVTYSIWKSRLDSDPRILGRRFIPDDPQRPPVVIAGVLPPQFVFPGPEPIQALRPLRQSATDRANPRRRILNLVIARIPAALSTTVVQQRIEDAMQTTAASFSPAPLGGWGATDRTRFTGPFDAVSFTTISEYMSGRQQPIALAVFAAAGLLILLACVNASGLMLARGQLRGKEMAVRRALGASAQHIIVLVLTESLVVTAIGAVIGLAAAAPLLAIVTHLLPASLHLLKVPSIDWRVAAFAFIATTGATVVAALWPARQLIQRDVRRTGSSGTRVIVAGEVALGLTLALSGALLIGSLWRVWSGRVGFETEDVTAIELRLSAAPARVRSPDVLSLLARIRAVPGVVAAAVSDAIVLQQSSNGNVLGPPPPGVHLFVDTHAVTSGFFDVMRPPLVDGRYPTSRELDEASPVVVVGESVAQAYWPGERAVGQSIEAARATFTVVGVLADGRYGAWDMDPRAVVYGPYEPFAMSTTPNLLVKTTQPSVLTEVLSIVSDMPDVAHAVRIDTVDALLSESIRPRRLYAWLFGTFGVSGLLIVGVGVFGVLAVTTGRRTREIGIRMALGATPASVVVGLLREQLATVLVGLMIGSLLSAWFAGFLGSYTYQTQAYDLGSWLAAVGSIALVATIGTMVPAVRASHISPLVTLKVDE